MVGYFCTLASFLCIYNTIFWFDVFFYVLIGISIYFKYEEFNSLLFYLHQTKIKLTALKKIVSIKTQFSLTVKKKCI